jgi:nucleoside-diphosphate-sugar epimerase
MSHSSNRQRVLITGINGLIGEVIRVDLQGHYEVYGLDIQPPYSETVFEADISEFDKLLSTVSPIMPLDFIVHLAGESNSQASWESVLRPNIIGTRNVFEVARRLKVPRVIFASSNHVTGAYEGFLPHLHLHLQPEPEKIKHTDPIRPDGDYGVSKAFGEAIARYYCARWGIEAVCLRIGTVNRQDSPGQDPRIMKTWLSHRDLRHLIDRSLKANVMFGIYYGVSDNKGAFWDISNARDELGYEPRDNASG